MLSKIKTASLWGVESELITVEVYMQNGMPALRIVGLADITIKEAQERIRAAIQSAGYAFPRRRITINLSPAGRPKEGSHFDLPIAMGILCLEKEPDQGMPAYIGELSLDGDVKQVRGALPLAIGLREQGIRKLVLPKANLDEVSLLGDMLLYPVENLREAMQYKESKPYEAKKVFLTPETFHVDFEDVAGQENVKRAMMIAAAGNHGALMMGSPGCGKTMMARRMPTIMPDMTYEEQLDMMKVYSISGLLPGQNPNVGLRPFRSPHHTITKAALIGGGKKPKPGEISLAHSGILFLDEFGEFDGKILEVIRQPIEDGQITITRTAGAVVFPSRIMLIAAANPCKCGYLGDEAHSCTCTESQRASYAAKFSGPLMDRIDLHIQVLPVKYEQIQRKSNPLSSAKMKEQVDAAVRIQQMRYAGTEILFNSRLSQEQIKKHCILGKEEKNLLKEAYEKLGLSMRTYYKVIKISRTIADLQGSQHIQTAHIAEALQYRALNPLYGRL